VKKCSCKFSTSSKGMFSLKGKMFIRYQLFVIGVS